MLPKHVDSDTLLYLENVSVSFDGFKALNELSLVILKNELRCVIGANGAGKSTMMDVVTGKTRPDAGRVLFGANTDLTRLDEATIANLGIGRKFQKPTVFERHSVEDNLVLAMEGSRGIRDNLLFRMTAANRQRLEEILELINLADRRDHLAGAISHGQKQWLEIGMLLMQNPQLLLVDEPVAGMTHQEMERTAELLTRLAEHHAVVIVEHDMEFIRSIARKVTVLHQGSVLAEGPMEMVQNHPKVVEVYLGE